MGIHGDPMGTQGVGEGQWRPMGTAWGPHADPAGPRGDPWRPHGDPWGGALRCRPRSEDTTTTTTQRASTAPCSHRAQGILIWSSCRTSHGTSPFVSTEKA